jgi:hypothetical protein
MTFFKFSLKEDINCGDGCIFCDLYKYFLCNKPRFTAIFESSVNLGLGKSPLL